MAISRVWIEEDCIVCNACEDVCPEVFSMTDETAVVNKGVDLNEFEEQIIEAAESCPTEVIKYE